MGLPDDFTIPFRLVLCYLSKLALAMSEMLCLVQSLRDFPISSHHLRQFLQGMYILLRFPLPSLYLDIPLNAFGSVCHQFSLLSRCPFYTLSTVCRDFQLALLISGSFSARALLLPAEDRWEMRPWLFPTAVQNNSSALPCSSASCSAANAVSTFSRKNWFIFFWVLVIVQKCIVSITLPLLNNASHPRGREQCQNTIYKIKVWPTFLFLNLEGTH